MGPADPSMVFRFGDFVQHFVPRLAHRMGATLGPVLYSARFACSVAGGILATFCSPILSHNGRHFSLVLCSARFACSVAAGKGGRNVTLKAFEGV